jgi:hypothetical protein
MTRLDAGSRQFFPISAVGAAGSPLKAGLSGLRGLPWRSSVFFCVVHAQFVASV